MSLKDTVQAKDEGQTEKALRRAADKLEEIFRDVFPFKSKEIKVSI